jgi:hypothetical protein
VLDRFCIGEPGARDWARFTVDHVVGFLAVSGCLRPEFRDVDLETAELVRQGLGVFTPPREAVALYLGYLARFGLVLREPLGAGANPQTTRWYRGKQGAANRRRLSG